LYDINKKVGCGPVHNMPEKFENSTIITGHFGFVFEENSGKEIT